MSSSRPPRDHEETREISVASRRNVKARPRHQVSWTDAIGIHMVKLEERTLAGSAQGARIVLLDPTVSRLHAELEPRDNDVWVHDLGSTNGTFVEGVQVTGAKVPDGGRVRLGETTLLIGRESTPGYVNLWPGDRFGDLVGKSAAMRELFAQLARVAPMDSSVLIQGETGTGKELVARAIHDASPRAKQPFMIIDCAALPEHLLESELFGHVKGAFTGASASRAGAIEAAHEGTVFLDEIGELPLAMQPKLLRVLESRCVRRIGEPTYRDINVRFICATHRDLGKMVNAGSFREDLYFRLAVFPVTVPPLRVRAGDIAALVHHFLPVGKSADFTPDVMAVLAARQWLGNVRELRNFLERALVLGPKEALAMGSPAGASGQYAAITEATEEGSVPPASAPTMSFDKPFKEVREQWLDHLEREYLKGLLAKHNRNVNAAAATAGLDRTYIYRLIRKHRI